MPENRINFTPSEHDQKVIELIQDNNPVTAQRGVDAMRKALEIYWFIYGPSSGMSRKDMAKFTMELQKRIAENLGVEYEDLQSQLPTANYSNMEDVK